MRINYSKIKTATMRSAQKAKTKQKNFVISNATGSLNLRPWTAILILVLWMSLRKTASRHSHQYCNMLKKITEEIFFQICCKETSWEINMCMGGQYYVSWVHEVSWCEMDSATGGEKPVVDSHEHGSEPTLYVIGGEWHDLLSNYQLLTVAWSTRSSTKVMPTIFFLRNYTYI